jgi:hypothetical protein
MDVDLPIKSISSSSDGGVLVQVWKIVYVHLFLALWIVGAHQWSLDCNLLKLQLSLGLPLKNMFDRGPGVDASQLGIIAQDLLSNSLSQFIFSRKLSLGC